MTFSDGENYSSELCALDTTQPDGKVAQFHGQ